MAMIREIIEFWLDNPFSIIMVTLIVVGTALGSGILAAFAIFFMWGFGFADGNINQIQRKLWR